MAKNVFSIPIFFIVFRETLEAAIIVSVLLGLIEQIVTSGPPASDEDTSPSEDAARRKRLLRKLRLQVFLGAAIGFFIALAIGAAFIAVWFTQASNLWSQAEELWEGIFELIAAIMIFVMGITMLKMDRAKAKWRVKLAKSFEKGGDTQGKSERWAMFLLPLITVMREGLEAVVFVGGVSLGQPATSIPLAAIIGIICGLIVGYLIYAFASRTAITVFMIVMTNLILLIGAGLFSRSVGSFERHAYNDLLGAEVDDSGGDGPGSYPVAGNVWHLDCCNPENNLDTEGWSVFNAIFGWSNNGSLGTILAYVFYWIAVIVTLIAMKFKEGRTTLFGKESAAGARRRHRREKNQSESPVTTEKKDSEENVAEAPTLPK